MKRLHFLGLVLLTGTIAHGQTFDSRSERISLNIKDFTRDSIPPVLVINYPTSRTGFPIYERDSVVMITGKAEDPGSDVAKILVNGVKPDSLRAGKFMARVVLKRGENEVIVQAFDKNRNVTTRKLRIVQDPNADITAPLITILEPITTRGFKVISIKDTLVLRARVTDQSGILGVSVNNISIDSLKDGEFAMRFPVSPDTLVVTAVDVFGNTSTRQILVMKDETANPDSLVSGTYYALVIAIQDYAELDNLYRPIPDAEAFIKTLTSKYTFDEKNITFLKNPDRRAILRAFEGMKSKVKSNDNLLVFYAGHGEWDLEIEQGYWLPANASGNDRSEWISDSNIRDFIKGIKSKHTLLVVDACFSAGIFGEMREAVTGPPKFLREVIRRTSRTALTSGENKPVPDQSVFMKYLLKTMQENTDQYLTASSLHSNLKTTVVENSPVPQFPRYGTILGTGSEANGDFVFMRKQQ